MRTSGADSPSTPAALSPGRTAHFERTPSPRPYGGPRRSTPSRLPSITAHQPLEIDDTHAAGNSSHGLTQTVFGFSPQSSTPLLSTSPVAATFMHGKAGAALPVLSPSLVSADPQLQQYPAAFFPGGELAPAGDSPHVPPGEFPPRSRRNSAAIVSISLSSRSRSRTPRGSKNVLPDANAASTSATPSKSPTPKGSEGPAAPGPLAPAPAAAWAPGVDDMDDWQPAGGIMLDADESTDVFTFDDDSDAQQRSWTASSDADRVADVLRIGMEFGEGIEFEGDIITPAVGRMNGAQGDVHLPLRRDGSQAGRARQPAQERKSRTYEVIRQLGSGSYAVVYLVRELGGRKREFALKCLSKHDLEEEQLETQLFEAHIHLSLPIHQNIVTLHDTLQTKNWLFLMLELCPGEDLFYWLERSRDASPPPAYARLPGADHRERGMDIMSSSRLSSSSIPFSSSQLFPSNFAGGSYSNSPGAFSPNGFGSSAFSGSPASLLFAHHNGGSSFSHAATPPTPSLLSDFSANTLLTPRRLRLIASMFSQMCEAVAVCHDAGVAHRDIKPENFICCDSVELETVIEEESEERPDFGPQAKRKVVVKLTDFGLATTDEESGDVECGSKPYMSYECRNNLGPTYRPAPADVWSLGIVLVNMLFHRNPWKDPTEGDGNFDTFMADPTAFFLSKFTGIGKEVATYLAERVMCIEVEDRVSAHELGQWIRNLPEMIGGRRAIHHLKMARLENRKQAQGMDKTFFSKAPIPIEHKQKSALASALASTVQSSILKAPPSAPPPVPPPPVPPPAAPRHHHHQPDSVPSLSSLPPSSELANVAQAAPTPDLEPDEVRSATTVDDHPTPTDMSTVVSPEPMENGDAEDGERERAETENGDAENGDGQRDADEQSLNTGKRRKRGVRKGKAAQAAIAAAKEDDTTKEERDAFLAELVVASEELARDLSNKKPFDPKRIEDFPPLGMSPQQAASGRKSRWKDFLAMSKGNPQLEALARRVADRETDGGWSAPAKLQHQAHKDLLTRSAVGRDTSATSSGFSSQASSTVTATSSATSSSNGNGPEDDDWRRPAREREREREAAKRSGREDGSRPSSASSRRHTEDSSSRARQAALAAAALTSGMGMEPMGAFGRPSHLSGRAGPAAQRGSPLAGPPRHPRDERRGDKADRDRAGGRWAPPTSSVPMPGAASKTPLHVTYDRPPRRERDRIRTHPRGEFDPTKSAPAPIPESDLFEFDAPSSPTPPAPLVIPPASGSSTSTTPTAPEKPVFPAASSASLATITAPPPPPPPVVAASPETSPNKPKLKGQISSLAKMLGGLKTKGRD